MDLRRLHHFVTLLDVGSYVGAAARLNLTQSALSHSIRSLEEQAEAALLDRSRRSVVPTAAGRLLEEEARAILQRMAHVRHNLKVVAGLEAATVRFGMAPLPARLWLAEVLAGLVDPGEIIAAATVGHAAGLTGLLERETIDFFVCAREGLTRHDGFEISPLGTLGLALLVRTDHPLARLGETLRPADLAAYPLLGMGRAFLRGDPNEPAPAFRGGRLAAQSDDYDALARVSIATDAVLLAAPGLGRAYDGQLVALPPVEMGRPMAQHLVCVRRAGRDLPPAARLVIDRLMAVAALPD